MKLLRRLKEVYWRRLPEHTRRGLLRLYIVVTVPWVAWYGYQILDAFNRYPSYRVWSYASRAFWSLLLVPMGAPIFFLAFMWIVTGFRKPAPDAHEARPTQNSNKGSRRGSPVPPEVEAIFKKLDFLMNNDKAQIDGLPEPFRSEVLKGADCDEVNGAAGEFGRHPRNPIPVNGPLGEVIYLSSLRTAGSEQIMFHRLGSAGHVDVYETVSFDGAAWDVLFFDFYHPRKSRRAPTGYRIATGAERENLLLGANEFVAAFPDKLPDAIANTYERLLGGRMRPRQVREAIERRKFIRQPDHQSKFDSLVAVLGSASFKPPLDFLEVGRTLASLLMDPDDCWRDACKLREYNAPGPVATCEVAFARAAVIKDAIKRCQPEEIATKMLAGVDRLVAESFANEDTEESLRHYKNERLSVVAPRTIRLYERDAFPLTQLADVFASRLSVPGVPAIEIAPLFEEVAEEAERLMKISSLLTKLGGPG